MKTIPEMLERGFGLISINEMISLTFHDDVLQVHFQPLPGLTFNNDQGWTLPIASRSEDGILEEINDYFYQLMITYYNHIAADLIKM